MVNDMNDIQPIGNPSIMARLNEALGYLSTLERHFYDMDSSLFGKGQSEPKPSAVSSTLDSMAAEACSRAANLCGWIATIKGGLGCSDSVNVSTSNMAASPAYRR